LAWSILTHADIHLTIQAGPSLQADAFEAANLVSARRAIQAWIGRAIVDIDLAGSAGVAFAAVADESVVQIDAAIRANRVARIAQTLINLRFALQPDEAGSALANESF